MSAQTARPMSLQACENAFVQNSLVLLAEKYNISVREALVVQAKLFPNPYVSGEFNAINPQNSRVLDVGGKGQKAIAVQQLLLLGHKKLYEVEVAKQNAQLAQSEYQDLVRNLKFVLRSNYFSAYYDNLTVKAIEKRLSSVDTLLRAYSAQAQKGNIPLSNVVRLQSLELSLQNNRNQLLLNIIDAQKQLSLLMGSDTVVVPTPTADELARFGKQASYTYGALLDLAQQNRPDYAAASQMIQAQEAQLRWQKSLAVPDVTVGASYDQRGGAFANQLNLTFGVPLPLWNKNQGNIQAAAAGLEMATTQQKQMTLTLQAELTSALQKYRQAYANYQNLGATLLPNLETVERGIFENFARGNVSLLAFTDFLESYNESITQYNEFAKALALSREELDFVVGTPIQ